MKIIKISITVQKVEIKIANNQRIIQQQMREKT